MDFSKEFTMNLNWSHDDQVNFLSYCAERYEINGSSPLSDSEYDYHFGRLEKIIPEHHFFETVGGINTDKCIRGQLVKHEYVMGSLIKHPANDLKTWISNTFLNYVDNSVILMHKVDGLSLSLEYNNGKLVQAISRGDGDQGVLVTHAARCVRGVKENIEYSDKIFVRGEVIKLKKDFNARWSDNYANARNFASGTMALDSDKTDIIKDRQLDFIAYEVISESKLFNLEYDKIAFLDGLGFQTLKSTTKRTKNNLSHELLEQAINIYMNDVGIKRDDLEYGIDGIVVKVNDIEYGKTLGSVSGGKKHKSAVALKYPPPEAITKIINVEFNTGRTGRVTPVGILDPVSLAGAVIKRATLHNCGELIKQDAIKIGATVVIARKGDIIPQIQKIISNGNTTIDIPTVCPSCGEPITWNDTHVDLICDNLLCPAQAAKRIDNWFKVINVKGIGKETLLKLITLQWENEPIVNCISDMYYKLDNDRQTEHPFRKYAFIKENFGDVTYNNIIKAVNSVKEVPLHIFVCALGIGKIGSMSKDITDIAPSIQDIDKLTFNDLQGLPGFGPIKAKNFVDGWKKNRDEIDILLKYVAIKQNTQLSNKLFGKKFCFTGSFSSPTRGEMERSVPEHGGKLAAVGKGLTALISDGEIAGNKVEKAKQLNIPIITQEQFLDMLK